jgi:glyoxylase-like metal-dependent hydrolase (beta-lactamase superfamily II)
MANYEVNVLKPGYTKWVNSNTLHADGTITLITGPKRILVDTGGPWDRDFLIDALRERKLRPSEIDCVICTHGHSDHTGNINLFADDATLIVSYDISKGDLYTVHDFASGVPYAIDERVQVLPTPGHSGQDVSVIVNTGSDIVAVVGDLFESESDLMDDHLWRSVSALPSEQERNRNKILGLANIIVPGHGDAFRIDPAMPLYL